MCSFSVLNVSCQHDFILLLSQLLMRQETRKRKLYQGWAVETYPDMKFEREENEEEVACLRERRKDPNIKAAVDKRGRMGQDDDKCACL